MTLPKTPFADRVLSRWLHQRRVERYLRSGVPVSGGSDVIPQYGPGIYYVPLLYDPATGGYPTPGTGFIDNFPVTLPAFFKNCAILNFSQTASMPDTNVFLHFAPFVDTLLSGNSATGRAIQLGALPQVYPLELGAQSKQWRKHHFACGIPKNVFLSSDFPGTGVVTRLVGFYNDDYDYTIFPFTP